MKKLLTIGALSLIVFGAQAADLKIKLDAIIVDKYVKAVDSEEFSNSSVKLSMVGRFSGKQVKNTSINETSESTVERSIIVGNDEITINQGDTSKVFPAKISNNGKTILVKARDLTGFDGGLSKKMSGYGISKTSVKVSDMECELLSSSVLECEREVRIRYKR